jgi:hypothetical protein
MNEPSVDTVLALTNASLGVGLVLLGVWFFINRIWPWWTARDEVQRDRDYQQAVKQIEASLALAGGLEAIALVLESFKPLIAPQAPSEND